ncbi:TPA: hypothetical protein JBC26_15865 [Legionella pneumophila subsp. pneumophila]|nr:hypothetical protein [Legionella pneumophila subsp. pneumophila]HAT9259147.1 hypothetical protein [Legionella pneumophila subsp. pneumophila]
MSINLHDLLPDELSDEAAYHLANFAMALATAIDEIYFSQTLRYIRSSKLTRSLPSYLCDEEPDDPPF